MLFKGLSLSTLLFEILTFMSTEFSKGSLVIVLEQLNNLLLKLTFETVPLLLFPLFGIKSFPGAIVLYYVLRPCCNSSIHFRRTTGR